MKKTIFTIAFLGLLLPLTAMQHVPFELNFSDPAERAKWQFTNLRDTIPTSWVIGYNPDYAYGNDYMLYLSNDGGATRTYDIKKDNYTCVAYYLLDTLPLGNYTLEFRYRGISSYTNTYIKVWTTSTTPKAPSYNSCYYCSGSYGSTTVMGKWWNTGSHFISSDGNTPYYLCFTFYQRGSSYGSEMPVYPNPGYAIDGIQIYPADAPPACTQLPRDLQLTRSGNDAIISWAGNASEYQLEYFLNDTSAYTRTVVDNVTTTSYTLHCEQVPEGSYTFRVRSICSRDTSGWAGIDYQLVYDISKHCMDYLNFDDPDVKPQYGYVWNPGYYNNVDDRGFTSEWSRHTIHNYPRDYDERTNNQLRTFPEGQPAAIRLGNWRTGGEAEDIVYTMQVTPEMSILQLRYALVMQLPGHDVTLQPRFTLEFLDSVGVLIDSCGYVDFTASADLEGWHTVQKEGETDIIWKDWSMVGLNMRDYIGRTIQVRITTKDCGEGAHFGYAYFTMGCSDSKIQGIHCGVKPDHFTVDEGFYYRWYQKYDPKHIILSREQTYHLTDPMDTATYCVDMINMIDTSCYFTLEASSLAFIPHSDGVVKYVPSDCKNYVQLADSSSTYGVYWDADGKMVKVTDSPGADERYWDLGTYGTSTESAPKLRIPDSGDSLHIVLHTYMDNRQCEDSMVFNLVVPAVGTARTIDTYYFCRGGSITHAGKTYTEEIDFSDTLTGSNGCDSISTVALRFFRMDTISVYDTICTGGSLEWYGQTLTEAGEYFTSVPSLVYDCDSVYNIMYLHKQPYLNMSLNYTQQHVCPEGGAIEIPFTVIDGTTREYDLLFSETAKTCGFEDRMAQAVAANAGSVSIALTDSLQPGVYDASLVFHNLHCDSMIFPIVFAVYYNPDSLINQRWNDFLSVRKTAFDAYGGFTDYQWYKNDEPLPGQTGSQLYVPDERLDPADAYAVEMTRIRDGVRVRTCPYYPTVQPETSTITVHPTVVTSQHPENVHIRLSVNAQAVLYNQAGVRMHACQLHSGDNSLIPPAQSGLYLLYLVTDAGEQRVQRIIVQ